MIFARGNLYDSVILRANMVFQGDLNQKEAELNLYAIFSILKSESFGLK